MHIEANILSESGFIQGNVVVEGEFISAVEGEFISENQAKSNGLPWLFPGFIDCHVHGGGGFDVMEGETALEQITKVHAQHGTTALLATTLTSPPNELASTFKAIANAMSMNWQGGSCVLGAHLEGPYINPHKLGAQPDFARPFDLEELLNLHATAPIRVITLATEIAGHLDAIDLLIHKGIRVQQGHSVSSYDDALLAFNKGARGFTHLFNAMSGLQHRAPGVVGAALAHAEYAEIIPDLIHVHPGALHTAARCIPKLFTVTDATSATGMPDGAYQLGSHQVFKCMGCVKLADGTLAGSALTMDQAFRNWVDLGFSLEDASHKTSLHAADYLGEYQRGRIRSGLFADLVLLDKQLNLKQVWIKGVSV
jgi:N-acetylglucosamine-6-phosphate deacetylase